MSCVRAELPYYHDGVHKLLLQSLLVTVQAGSGALSSLAASTAVCNVIMQAMAWLMSLADAGAHVDHWQEPYLITSKRCAVKRRDRTTHVWHVWCTAVQQGVRRVFPLILPRGCCHICVTC